jgi:tetratricopeptide (TPR) repeat protein
MLSNPMGHANDDWLDELLRQAKQAHEQEREAVVAELLGPYLERRPHEDYAWFLFGDALRVMGLTDEAERALLKAVELAPGPDWVLQLTLAHLYKDAGNPVEAERWFELAAEDENAAGQAWFWILRGSNLSSHGQFKQAEKCLRQAIALGDDNRDEALLNLGYVLRAQGRYLEAKRLFRQALDLNPDYALADKALRSLEGVEKAISLARKVPKES